MPSLRLPFTPVETSAAPDVVEGITQQRLFSKGEVLRDGDGVPLVGVSSIDADSAEVLVVSDQVALESLPHLPLGASARQNDEHRQGEPLDHGRGQ